VGRHSTGLSFTTIRQRKRQSQRQRRRERTGGNRLWGDQSAKARKPPPLASSPYNKPIGASKIVSITAGMSRIARGCLSGTDCWGSSGVSSTQWRRTCFDGLASRSQCGFSDAAFLRTSSRSPTFTVWHALAGKRVNQKALTSF
jgi:hypothetical protein